MTIVDYVVIFAVLAIFGGAMAYIIRAKKRGKGCIGCPDSKNCNGNCSSCVTKKLSDE